MSQLNATEPPAGDSPRSSEVLGRCGRCKHWRRNTFGDEPHAGRCESDRFVYDQETPQDGLQYWDYESRAAGFNTGENFGCVHWVAA